MRVEAAPIDELALERGKKALSHRVIIAVTDRAHRGAYTGFPTATPEGYRRVLGRFKCCRNISRARSCDGIEEAKASG